MWGAANQSLSPRRRLRKGEPLPPLTETDSAVKPSSPGGQATVRVSWGSTCDRLQRGGRELNPMLSTVRVACWPTLSSPIATCVAGKAFSNFRLTVCHVPSIFKSEARRAMTALPPAPLS